MPSRAPMKIPILIEATEDQRFRATGGEPFASAVEADTPEAALDEIKKGNSRPRRARRPHRGTRSPRATRIPGMKGSACSATIRSSTTGNRQSATTDASFRLVHFAEACQDGTRTGPRVPTYERHGSVSELSDGVILYGRSREQIREAWQSVPAREPHGSSHRGHCHVMQCDSCHSQPSRLRSNRSAHRSGLEPELAVIAGWPPNLSRATIKRYCARLVAGGDAPHVSGLSSPA